MPRRLSCDARQSCTGDSSWSKISGAVRGSIGPPSAGGCAGRCGSCVLPCVSLHASLGPDRVSKRRPIGVISPVVCRPTSCDDLVMGAAGGSDAVAGGGARPGAGGGGSRPGLFERLGASARVTVVSAPPGSGKTVLLRSWIGAAGLTDHAAWVPVGRNERDPQRFWPSVGGALRQTAPGSALVQALTAAPDLDGWAITERLLKDLAPLQDRVWLVVDDVHELGSAEARRQLELLLMRAPPQLRFVLATRHDVQLGLHRLRLEGELAEIRAPDLRFSLGEA